MKRKTSEPTDALLLLWTLVADQVVTTGYEQDFVALEPVMIRTSDASAKMERQEKRAEDQFHLAAQEKPTRFSCRYQQQYFERPSARRNAEGHLRRKWLEILENLLRATKTPMGVLITKARSRSTRLDPQVACQRCAEALGMARLVACSLVSFRSVSPHRVLADSTLRG